jgi:hypothetical protein
MAPFFEIKKYPFIIINNVEKHLYSVLCANSNKKSPKFTQMKYVINLFGTGIRYWDCHVEKEIFDEMSKIKLKHNVEWENLLFDLDFLQHYGFDHWSELSPNSPRIGFLLKTENTIEIKQGSKLITRFKSSELDEKQVLFPLYQTKEAAIPERSIENHIYLKLLQLEKGLISKYCFQTDVF